MTKDNKEHNTEDNLEQHYLESEVIEMRKKGKLIELNTTKGNTVYLDIDGLTSAEIKMLRNSTVELENGRATIVEKKKVKE